MGLQDRALIRALVLTGARRSDIASVPLDRHVYVHSNHNGDPATLLLLPNVKNQRGDDVEHWITGKARVEAVHARPIWYSDEARLISAT